ncbi:acetyl-CoA carboxylase biotin carboxylase subunit [Pedobacter sp. AK013]|uniref:acetyl-CoA carboxylase biotin carboxylase subunit n=1 Tax=Pedobacter sp. AK013 TaxID=2723071 RepID=UPI0018439886|nr:acetyl-CoA carboxylase biotin carboxylase subunit [Pedobacter sp. AK013]MBB6239696.1 acetyl-CoA carboxylase biotin carboxylase subunit [Pedobacter sp. AK013]
MSNEILTKMPENSKLQTPISKLLVANRGEIALRIMRSAKGMGIKTVAVFSEADRNALHVRYADEAVCIGPAPSNQSYLVGEKIIDACKLTGAQAIHPGYGFLSENAGFAQKVADAGLILVGPSPEAMETMGNKLSAKAAALKYNIPMVPGTEEAIQDVNEAKQRAIEVGFPILIKAAAGGGGKGMRIVERPEDFEEQMQLAVSEATSAFGDGAVFIERYVTSPRHIEIQVLGDSHGNIVHLFERECSVQRRHQKVVEEAPSAVLTEEIRQQMGKCAVDVARSVNYTGAGTVEFILDENLDFFFLEMNTRLQVEHPVTELITGIDLVKEQIKIASGEKLSFSQEDLKINGHAIELRVYAEDPANNFLPDIGTLQTYSTPKGNGVRVDDGFEEGMEIPIYYDPMIAKLITYGKDREEAIERMVRAIEEYDITGIETTLGFGKFVMLHEAFKTGNFDTHFVGKYFKPESLKLQDETEALIAAVIAAKLFDKKEAKLSDEAVKSTSDWRKNRLKY